MTESIKEFREKTKETHKKAELKQATAEEERMKKINETHAKVMEKINQGTVPVKKED
jgi:hypothetical protein